jgi:hypothetical protein
LFLSRWLLCRRETCQMVCSGHFGHFKIRRRITDAGLVTTEYAQVDDQFCITMCGCVRVCVRAPARARARECANL